MRRFKIIILLAFIYAFAVFPVYGASQVKSGFEGKTIIDTERGIAALENCGGTYTFTDSDEIKLIAVTYGLEDPAKIEEICYIPIALPEEVNYIEKNGPFAIRYFDEVERSLQEEKVKVEIEGDFQENIPEDLTSKYYMKNTITSEPKAELIRSSWYCAPGGSMEVSQSFSGTQTPVKINLLPDVMQDILSLRFERAKAETINDTATQDVSVKEGYKRNVKAYLNKLSFSGELRKNWIRKGDRVDTRCGDVEFERGIGFIFVIYKEIPGNGNLGEFETYYFS
ncbi:MAG TPA: hypothetical protein GX736_01305 [Mogibacterium sp.]|nr:hypothetical protein [Mogibacterium sp.]